MYYIGADLGTSGIKMILVDNKGNIIKNLTKGYDIYYPKDGWSEQNPEDWWNSFKIGIKELTEGVDKEKIKCIGIDGQMHGLVILDENDQVIRPAILWNDTRSYKETDYLNNEIGTDKLADWTGNIAFPGFTAPKILWLKNNEVESFNKISKIMLPKDYLTYRLVGRLFTDQSDASGTLLLDVKNRKWSEEMIEICGINTSNLPELRESYDIIGNVTDDIAAELGLSNETKVIAGAGDNEAAAIGLGATGKDKCNISIGTSGTVFVTSEEYANNGNHSVHNFAHADGHYHYLGCMLSAASANNWWVNNILNAASFDDEQQFNHLGYNEVIFLPYLMGERSPHNDAKIRSSFIGMNMSTTKYDMNRSVLEGITFGLRDSLEIIKKSGINVESATLCGGAAKSKIWREIAASILNVRIDIPEVEEGPAFGSAILAMVADGQYETIKEACSKLVSIKESVYPNQKYVEEYNQMYKCFCEGYISTKDLCHKLVEILNK